MSWEEGRRNILINRRDHGVSDTRRPTMRSVMQDSHPPISEVMTPYSDDPIRLWEEV